LKSEEDSVNYKRAIVRRPGRNFSGGITTSSLGKPDWRKALNQHEAYCEALVDCDVELTVLEADERYPDGCFVEDTAIVTPGLAVITRPGTVTRRGEEEEIASVLSQYRPLERIMSPGTIEGGDVLRKGEHFYVGISARTNWEGARQLASLLASHGYTSSEVAVDEGLHLKSDIAYLGNGIFICTPKMAAMAGQSGRIIPDETESYAANCLAVNGKVLIARGFPKTARIVAEMGYSTIELDMSEFRKMDGGLTCLSLLF
jgi:dimethylargininase